MLDENDNSPRFDFTSDSAISVPEDCPVGQRVATVKAQDPDAGSNGQVGGHQARVYPGYRVFPTSLGTSEPLLSPSRKGDLSGEIHIYSLGSQAALLTSPKPTCQAMQLWWA